LAPEAAGVEEKESWPIYFKKKGEGAKANGKEAILSRI